MKRALYSDTGKHWGWGRLLQWAIKMWQQALTLIEMQLDPPKPTEQQAELRINELLVTLNRKYIQ